MQPDAPDLVTIDTKTDPATVALGRLGGKKGAPARANKLSKKKIIAIAQKAGKLRWSAKKPDENTQESS